MLIERQANAVVVWAPAKVNLYLELLAKRADGYHEIATLLVAVTLYDRLVFLEDPSGEVRIQCNLPGLPTGVDNLVYRAAREFGQRTATKTGAFIRLEKRIPVAAGLAGGSTDAAAALAGLNQLWGLRLEKGPLVELAAELGSDVAFFFSSPAAWCTGRGEVVRPLQLGKTLWFVLVCPPFGLATADVYRAVTVPANPKEGSALLAAAQKGDVAEIAREMYNRLQPAALKLCPSLAEYQTRLEHLAPAGVMQSGSGSAWFALCRNQSEAQRIAYGLRRASAKGLAQVFIVRSCS
jgi:4-diphosphocytidyl-2-C-methyl-D-erythritol kinase